MNAPNANASRQFRPSRRAVASGLLALALLPLGLWAAPASAEDAEPAQAAPALELLMFEQDGCPWCAKWDAQISAVYPKTQEGRRAPLRRWDIHAGAPRDATLERPARFTPTFVLLSQGREIGRIEGYPGEDFFWPMLDQLIAKADAEKIATR